MCTHNLARYLVRLYFGVGTLIFVVHLFGTLNVCARYNRTKQLATINR